MILKVTKSTKLKGDIYISGSKNAALPCICAALLTKKSITINNVPDILDVNNLLKIIAKLGVKVKKKEDQIFIQAKVLKPNVVDDLVETLRGSYYLIGPVLARNGHLKIKYPGGCKIGERPIDYHLYMLKELGFIVKETDKFLDISMNETKDADLTFPKVSLGATINTILVACKIPCKVVINNPSLEPEVFCLIEMLRIMGACIYIKEGKIIIQGVKELNGLEYNIISDRMEAGSYLFLAAAIENSEITIHNINPEHLQNVIITAKFMGVKIKEEENKIIVKGPKKIHNINLLIGEYPFFPTDLQQIISVILTKAKKTSTIEDPIFPDRICHLKELRKLGAYIYNHNNYIYIKPSQIISSKVRATDLRGAFALIIAGAMGNRTTYIGDIDYLFRGYVDPVKKLKSIGVNVELL